MAGTSSSGLGLHPRWLLRASPNDLHARTLAGFYGLLWQGRSLLPRASCLCMLRVKYSFDMHRSQTLQFTVDTRSVVLAGT